MSLHVDPTAKVSPLTIPCPGHDTLSIDFDADIAGSVKLLRASYYLGGPYKFIAGSPAPGQIGVDTVPEEFKGKVLQKLWLVKADRTYFSGPLKIERFEEEEECPGTQADLPVGVHVQEVHPNNSPAGFGFKAAKTAVGRIAILSGALQELVNDSGLSKTAWAQALSEKLSKKGKNLSSSAILNALAGGGSATDTNDILRKELLGSSKISNLLKSKPDILGLFKSSLG